jgi:hypothetical protein
LIDAAVDVHPHGHRRDKVRVVGEHRATQRHGFDQHRIENRGGLTQHFLAMDGPALRLGRIGLRLDQSGQQRQLEEGRNCDQQQAFSGQSHACALGVGGRQILRGDGTLCRGLSKKTKNARHRPGDHRQPPRIHATNAQKSKGF